MLGRPGTLLSDAALDEIARRWFAEVRAQHPADEPTGKPRRDADGTGSDGLPDRLFGLDDDADGGSDGD